MPQMVSKEFVFVHVDGLEFFGLVILKTFISISFCVYTILPHVSYRLFFILISLWFK